ncbi:MAG: RNA 2',3'-cyclic phosphodiesterase [Candidatus Hydrogenedentota bacterium]|nr:MAG: RNA 2',3'-cyclic phosphodiesterase [Candidatus Hydrogenedentota bacterium]
MYRLFVAIQLPQWVTQKLNGLCFGLPGAKWADKERMHLTLRFIGEVDGAVFRDVEEALETVNAEPFELVLKGVGYFPPRRDPEVLWVGVQKNGTLVHLRNKVESALVRAGLEPESRKFSPHVALARLKGTPASRVARFMAENGLFKIEPFPVNEFHLYSSFLASEGAVHTVEASYELRAKGSRAS